jgi:hypothetical protein
MMRSTLGLTGLLAVLVAMPAAAQTLPANRTLEVTAEVAALVPADSILRVEANLAGRASGWSGVRSCGDGARAQAALRTAFRAWLGEQVAGHPGRRLLAWGWGNSTWSYSNSRDPWPSNARRCRGALRSAPSYVEFY